MWGWGWGVGTWGVLDLDLGYDLDGRQWDLQVGDTGELGEVVLSYKLWSSNPANHTQIVGEGFIVGGRDSKGRGERVETDIR
jgi:hypothetical protein